MSSPPRPQGAVHSVTNTIVALIADRAIASAWGGFDAPSYKSTTAPLSDGSGKQGVTAPLGDGAGLVLYGGASGGSVYRLAAADIVLIEQYVDDWNPTLEAEFLRVIARPLAAGATPVGVVDVASGELALLHAWNAGDVVESAPAEVAQGEFVDVEGGVVLGVPPGRYHVFHERLGAEGDWGSVEIRVRVVHEAHVDAAKRAQAKARPKKKAPRPESRLFAAPPGMRQLASLALDADGAIVVAGEKSGPGIAAWSTKTGELLWSARLAEPLAHYRQNVDVSIRGARVLALVTLDKVCVLDLATGVSQGTFQRPETRFARFTPDGEHILVGELTEGYVLAAADGNVVRELPVRLSQTIGAFPSPDGTRIALPGAALHFLDGKTLGHRKTVSSKSPTAAAYAPDGKTIALGQASGSVAFVDAESGEEKGQLAVVTKHRSIFVNEIAFERSGQRVAVATEDGFVRIWDDEGTLVKSIDGHDTVIQGTGSRSLHGLAWDAAGRLYVGGAPKGAFGITVYCATANDAL